MSGIFDTNLFREPMVGVLGAAPSDAEPVSALASYRSRFPSLPSESQLASKGASHFTVAQAGKGGAATFSFFNAAGDRVSGPTTLHAGGVGPVAPSPTKGSPTPAHREGDGLLPGSSLPSDSQRSEPKWLPWLLLGGGVVVAGGIVWTATRRKPKKNRRRKRRRRTSR